MSNIQKFYIGILIVLIVGIAIVEANRPKPIDWRPTYRTYKKNPLDLFVLNEQIPSILGNDIERIDETPYEHLTYFHNYYVEAPDNTEYEEYNDETYYDDEDSIGNYDSEVNIDSLIGLNENFEAAYENSDYETDDRKYSLSGTFLYINHDFEIDNESIESILDFIADGNQALISTSYFNKILLDSLNLSVDYHYESNDTLSVFFDSKTPFVSEFKMSKGFNGLHFSKTDSLKTIPLGYQKHANNSKKFLNFVAVKYKKGVFYLHTQPAAFSNYHLLKSNHAHYTTALLSFIPQDQQVLWFLKSQISSELSNSPMRYILSQPALRWAWYLFLIGMLLFMIFNAKRRQRKVPIVIPLKNTTVDFTKTIGNLYFQEGNHNIIIEKKIIFFLEKIRSEYYIETENLNDDFIKKLHMKSGKKLEIIQLIVRIIKKSRKTYQNSEEDLIALNKAIETFWK